MGQWGLNGVSGAGAERPTGAGQGFRWWRGPLVLLLLCLWLLLPWPAGVGRALALDWPGRSAPPPRGSLGVSSAQRLQEVPPPAAVQQLQAALADRAPQVRILAPAAGALLSGDPWTLRLQVDDWPLVDAGALGLGTHLLVQIDGGEPLRLTRPEATLPALSPGSHRVTVVAARPWGEAVKSPGAMAQIVVHRTAANPLSLPPVGTPQLLPVSPPPAAAAQPLLLDWLLVDAPLQHLRDDDARWRLRVTVNGDSFLVDRQTPLWLRGWRPGTNAVQLELLDGRGEPLNPPFNSLVQEVLLDPSQPRPAWQGAVLTSSDLAILLGQAPPPTSMPPLPAQEPSAQGTKAASIDDALKEEPLNEDALSEDALTAKEGTPAALTEEEGTADALIAAETTKEEVTKAEAQNEEVAMAEAQNTSPKKDGGTEEEPTAPVGDAPGDPLPLPETAPEQPPEPEEPDPLPLRSAREEVNPDGTLRREPRTGPLAGLRERLGR